MNIQQASLWSKSLILEVQLIPYFATITKEDMRFVSQKKRDCGYEPSSSKKKGENYNFQQV